MTLARSSSLFVLATLLLAPPLLRPAIGGDEKKAPELVLSAEEKGVLALINAERDKAGAEPLKASATLFELARGHSKNMVKLGEFNHTLEGKSPFDRAKDAGYPGLVAENIAAGSPMPAGTFQQWMNSKGHRENMLNPNYREAGIGVARNARGLRFWTLVLGQPFEK